ncbi:hypothetical protein V6N11_083971 [Hibiscus sabdariffa]|uniref:DUF7875 domain-containing protein n=1 Tax=Hibiscus sabdariffa TaxID=183260 RepID=A0ABR2QDF9_9ROSI
MNHDETVVARLSQGYNRSGQHLELEETPSLSLTHLTQQRHSLLTHTVDSRPHSSSLGSTFRLSVAFLSCLFLHRREFLLQRLGFLLLEGGALGFWVLCRLHYAPRITVPRSLRWAACGAVSVSSTSALLVCLFSPECEPQNIAAYDKGK